MIDEKEQPPEQPSCKRVYVAPVLVRLGTMEHLTQSVGNRGARDGQRRGRNKRTSF